MEKNKTCMAVGFFDSFHLGHAKIVDTVLEKSKDNNCIAKIVTLYDENALMYLSEKEKRYFIEKKGISNILSLPYTNDFSLKKLLIDENVTTLVVGENIDLFDMTVEDLRKIALPLGCEVVACSLVCYKGAPITMDTIKEACKKNNLEMFTELCGHPYTMIGTIVKGKQIGRTVGLPTANLSIEKNKILPELGVYSSISYFGSEKFMGMTNIGLRPTVDDEKRITVETFIIDFDRMVYGEECVLEVFFFTRGVKKFNTLQEVQYQVLQDIEVSKTKLSSIYKEKV